MGPHVEIGRNSDCLTVASSGAWNEAVNLLRPRAISCDLVRSRAPRAQPLAAALCAIERAGNQIVFRFCIVSCQTRVTAVLSRRAAVADESGIKYKVYSIKYAIADESGCAPGAGGAAFILYTLYFIL